MISEILDNKFSDLSERFLFLKEILGMRIFFVKFLKKFQKNQKSIDAVIHFAGLKAVNESILRPLEYWSTNVGGTLTLLKMHGSI